ncbi:hypothetical protein Taro_015854, partial [Colocasia esculenta]|nr:hypothetical protein [Colocasia esculenta]
MVSKTLHRSHSNLTFTVCPARSLPLVPGGPLCSSAAAETSPSPSPAPRGGSGLLNTWRLQGTMENVAAGTERGHGPKKKTHMQIEFLEKLYSEDKYPNQKDMYDCAAALNLTYNQVRKWFTDKRAKEKKENDRLISNKQNPRVTRALAQSCSTDHSGKEAHDEQWTALRQQVKKSAGRMKRLLQKRPLLRLQVLFPEDYILKKVFRNDGPPLGVEFDCLPAKGFLEHDGLENQPHSSQCGERISKRQKVCEPHFPEMEAFCDSYAPAKTYGVGKGLMTVWRATNPICQSLSTRVCLTGGKSKKKQNHVSQRSRNRELAMRQKLVNKSQEKRAVASIRKKKMSCNKDAGLKLSNMVDCKLAIDYSKSQEQATSPTILMDDEELELSELQTGTNPPRCSAHLASEGRNGCPLCKDMLARFPPPFVRMKQPISARPWDSSPELIKKFFKVLLFLYTHAMLMDICPFTLDELAQAFHDKDSVLLGKVHVTLLKHFLSKVERELSAGKFPRASKNCRFLGFLHAVRRQEFDVSFWNKSLNSLTWVEILRQVLISAGFATKRNSSRRSQTKGELYFILSEQGSTGSKVSELAKASQVIALDLCNTPAELELLIYSTLSSDCTLFEKIGPSAYRLRISPTASKGTDDSESDTDSVSVDEDSGCSSSGSSSDESYSSELDSSTCKQSIVRFTRCQKKKNKLLQSAEIDESFSGEAWLLGLMEGEYSDLSVEEKLEALSALVDLTSSCSSLRMEEPVREMMATLPDMRYRGSGGKIKKALPVQDALLRPLLLYLPPHPVGSSPVGSTPSNKEHSSGDGRRCCGPPDSPSVNNSMSKDSGCCVHTLQSIHLGSDRRYNSYWLFLGPCNGSDPGHRRVYFESSEDGHWEVIDTEQALSALLSVLDGRGVRESHLLSSLKKREAYLCQMMSDFLATEIGNDRRKPCQPSETDISTGDSSSPLSDVDNNLVSETIDNSLDSGAVVLELGKNMEEKKQKWDRLQLFDKWVWTSFYHNLNAVKLGRKSFLDMLVRCETCHDLYWRDEKHCRICHTTFELDFDLEERYAIHVATCRHMQDAGRFPSHRVLPSQLQALKASIHAVEACMPEDALVDAWTKSAHKLWIKRLRRTSTMPELIQVIADFVGAIRESWLYEYSHSLDCNSSLDDIAVLFQTMPQTTSAVALWLVKLDSLIAPHLQKLQSQTAPGTTQKPHLPNGGTIPPRRRGKVRTLRFHRLTWTKLL